MGFSTILCSLIQLDVLCNLDPLPGLKVPSCDSSRNFLLTEDVFFGVPVAKTMNRNTPGSNPAEDLLLHFIPPLSPSFLILSHTVKNCNKAIKML